MESVTAEGWGGKQRLDGPLACKRRMQEKTTCLDAVDGVYRDEMERDGKEKK